MTDDEIRAMPAGPEMDLAVARAIGWTKLYQRRAGEWAGKPPGNDTTYPVREFSTNIAAAWEVVVHLKKRFMVEVSVTEDDEGCSIVDDGHEIAFVLAGTAALAICRAALLVHAAGGGGGNGK